MRIDSVSISGFRGIEGNIGISAPLGLIAGPNNAGKSSVIDALRSVLQPFSEQQGQKWITSSDFTRTDSPGGGLPEIVITVHLADIRPDDRGRFISILSPLQGEGTGQLTLRATYGLDERVRTRYFGGDFDQNEVETIAREGIRFIYLHALRDASGDLRPGPGNRVANLVSAQAPLGHADRDVLTDIIRDANTQLLNIPSVQQSASAVQTRLIGMTGSGPFAHKTGFTFSEPKFEKVVNNLQSLLGATDLGQLLESGLGYNNLLYISVVLSALETNTDTPLSLLLIEEPESHLHPQLQTLLMEYLQTLSTERTQVLATTHSSQFASSAQVERITVLSRGAEAAPVTAHHLRSAPLDTKQFAHLRRFLDVTKSALLFAQGVILVEGIAEQLLMPVLATRSGFSLSNHGISVVSVDGLAFRPFMALFGPDALPHRCVVITDGDPKQDVPEDFTLSATATGLKELESDQHLVTTSLKTFEWDLAYYNLENRAVMIDSLKQIRPVVGARLESTTFRSAREFADAFLEAVENVKGPFAQELAATLEMNPLLGFTVPSYLNGAYAWVVGNV